MSYWYAFTPSVAARGTLGDILSRKPSTLPHWFPTLGIPAVTDHRDSPRRTVSIAILSVSFNAFLSWFRTVYVDLWGGGGGGGEEFGKFLRSNSNIAMRCSVKVSVLNWVSPFRVVLCLTVSHIWPSDTCTTSSELSWQAEALPAG